MGKSFNNVYQRAGSQIPGDGGTGPPQKKSGAKLIFLEIIVIFLYIKESLIAGLELNEVFLCYCNKPLRLCHGVKCELTFADSRYSCMLSGFESVTVPRDESPQITYPLD